MKDKNPINYIIKSSSFSYIIAKNELCHNIIHKMYILLNLLVERDNHIHYKILGIDTECQKFLIENRDKTIIFNDKVYYNSKIIGKADLMNRKVVLVEKYSNLVEALTDKVDVNIDNTLYIEKTDGKTFSINDYL